MLTLVIRTDKPEAEIGLYEDSNELDYEIWQAHRQLAETIHLKIKQLLDKNHKTLTDINAIVIYKGPGSFTGLRIGSSIANALAESLKVPLLGESGEDWREKGLARLQKNENDRLVIPEYGAPVHITQQKK